MTTPLKYRLVNVSESASRCHNTSLGADESALLTQTLVGSGVLGIEVGEVGVVAPALVGCDGCGVEGVCDGSEVGPELGSEVGPEVGPEVWSDDGVDDVDGVDPMASAGAGFATAFC